MANLRPHHTNSIKYTSTRRCPMNKIVVAILVTAVLPAFAPAARAQSLEELFRKVSPSVVVVRAKGRDVGAGVSPALPRRAPVS